MQTIKRLMGLVVSLGVFGLAIGMILPASWSVSRWVNANTDPAHIHPLVENLDAWPDWTGWASGANLIFDTSQGGSGPGSSLAWTDKRGLAGRLTITGSATDDGIVFDLALNGTAVNAHGTIAYAFDRDTQTTTITWSEKGVFEGRPLAGFLALFQGLTRGPRLDGALRQLKERAERTAHGG